MPETPVRFLGQEDSLEEGMATHLGILAWRIPWTEEPSGLQATGSQRVRHNWATKHSIAVCSVSSLWPYGLYSPLGFSVHEIFQAKIMEWFAITFSKESSWFRDQPASLASPALASEFFTTELPEKPLQPNTGLGLLLDHVRQVPASVPLNLMFLLPEILFFWRHQSYFFTSFWTSSKAVLMVRYFLSTLKLPLSRPDTYDSPFLFSWFTNT